MKTLKKQINRLHAKLGQGLVEFALIIPLLLLLLTGIIEFSYAMYTWVALQEVARIGVRYAVTGQFDIQYCESAGTTLNANAFYPGIAANDPNHDCIVESTVGPITVNGVKIGFEEQSSLLQDWARLPTIRDAAMHGGAGMLWDPAVSGAYLQYLEDPKAYSGFSQDYRGDPTANGYIDIKVCSSRVYSAEDVNNPRYYQNVVNRQNRYFGICTSVLPYTKFNPVPAYINDSRYFIDDAGGPGDRVRVYVTYDHPLITPFLNSLWHNLKMTTSQDGVVEKFRISRVSGQVGSIAALPALTLTASVTPLPSDTPVPSQTPVPSDTPVPSQTPVPSDTPSPTPTITPTDTITPSLTPTNTSTPTPCATNNGTGLRGSYFGNLGSAASNRFMNLVLVRIDPQVNFDWGSGSPSTSNPIITNDYYQTRWEGFIAPDWPGDYQFYTFNDDGTRVWVDGVQVISSWSDQGVSSNGIWSAPTSLTCGKHTIKIEYYENAGAAVMKLGWSNPMISGGKQIVLQKNLYPLGGAPATSTVTNTPTPSKTPTKTPTKSITPTPSKTPTKSNTPVPPTSTFTPKPPTNTVPPPPPTNTVPPTHTVTPPPPTNTVPPTHTVTPPPPTSTVPAVPTVPPPTRTITRTPTITPTDCNPELGGC